MKNLLATVGATYAITCLLGLFNFIEFRMYVGLEDKVIVSKAKYDDLIVTEQRWQSTSDTTEIIRAFKCTTSKEVRFDF